MKRWSLSAIAVVLGVAAIASSWVERRVAGALAHRLGDLAEIDAVLRSCESVNTGALQARAGTQLTFDPLSSAMRALRDVPRVAASVRARGPGYEEAADSLDRLTAKAREMEPVLEQLKTDLALLRLSSRYFPRAADALSHVNVSGSQLFEELEAEAEQVRRTPTGDGVARIAGMLPRVRATLADVERRQDRLTELRADVERFEQAPAPDVGRRLQAEVDALDAQSAQLEGAERSSWVVLLGHTRAILARRERVDRTVRSLVSDAWYADGVQARAAYERAAWTQAKEGMALKIWIVQAAASALALLLLVLRSRRPAPPRTLS